MHGAGNDFILINNMVEHMPLNVLRPLARAMCQEHFGIGADGLVVLEKPLEGGDFRMLFYNSDGSTAQMCGNGVRCAGRYGYEHGLAGVFQNIETVAGLVQCQRISGEVYKVRLNSPSALETSLFKYHGADIGYVTLGKPGIPHGVVEEGDLRVKQGVSLKQQDFSRLKERAQDLRWHRAFPEGANINFYRIEDNNTVVLATYERGVEDFTLSCGTGTGSVAAVLYKKGLIKNNQCKITSAGGTLLVDIEEKKDRINLYLTGSVVMVYEGIYHIFFKS